MKRKLDFREITAIVVISTLLIVLVIELIVVFNIK